MFIGTFYYDVYTKKRVISHPKIKTHTHTHTHRRILMDSCAQLGRHRHNSINSEFDLISTTSYFRIKQYYLKSNTVLRVFFWSGIDVVVYAARKSSSIIYSLNKAWAHH